MIKEDDVILKIIVPYITKIVNISIETGVFPECLKNGYITPILKKPSLDRNDMKNYRPVTNLSFLSKIIEKVVSKQFLEHVNKYELLDSMQSAYREGHSVETALVKVKNDIELALDCKKGTLLVLLDGSAAFDTVDIRILLDRLKCSFPVLTKP